MYPVAVGEMPVTSVHVVAESGRQRNLKPVMAEFSAGSQVTVRLVGVVAIWNVAGARGVVVWEAPASGVVVVSMVVTGEPYAWLACKHRAHLYLVRGGASRP